MGRRKKLIDLPGYQKYLPMPHLDRLQKTHQYYVSKFAETTGKVDSYSTEARIQKINDIKERKRLRAINRAAKFASMTRRPGRLPKSSQPVAQSLSSQLQGSQPSGHLQGSQPSNTLIAQLLRVDCSKKEHLDFTMESTSYKDYVYDLMPFESFHQFLHGNQSKFDLQRKNYQKLSDILKYIDQGEPAL